MEFIETPVFTRLITALLSAEEYACLQNLIVENPEKGDLVRGGGGIRKLRYGRLGVGKSAGIRVVYYWISESHQIYMLLAYPKSKKQDLTPTETAVLRDLVKEL